jgi:hypothetical protein
MPRYTVPTPSNISLVANTAKIVAAVGSTATRRPRIVGFELALDSVTGTDNSVLVELVRTDGTGAGAGSTAVTPVPVDVSELAAICSGAVNFSTDPSTVTVLRAFRVTPVGGTLLYPFEFADQPTVAATPSGNTRFGGIRLTAAQAQSNVRCTLTFEE